MSCCDNESAKSKQNEIFGIKGDWSFLDGVFLSNEEQEIRNEFCNKCEKLKLGFCSACGCIVKLKISLAASECPLKKWGIPEKFYNKENFDVRKN
jgi:hypothetical protein